MLKNAFINESVTTKIVLSILINTVLLLIVLSLLINQSYRNKLPIESEKIALNEIEKIASSIAYPLWYLDSAHVLQIIKNGIEKSELLKSISVKTRIENRNQPVLQIQWGNSENESKQYSAPIKFSSFDSTLIIGELVAFYIPNSPTIRNVIKEQFKINVLVIILFTTLLILIQIIVIRMIISKPLKVVKNSLDEFGETGIRKKVNWNSKDEFGEFISAHNQSIDHSIKLEDQLSEAKRKAEKASLSKTIFLSHMSHELRTPLTAILGFTQILKSDNSLNSEQEEYVSTINTCGDHLLNVINNILTLSKIESGEIELNNSSFNLREVINNVVSVLKIKAEEKNLFIKLSILNNLPQKIYSDENKIRQILFNLIGNAIKFTENGGITIKVKTSFIEKDSSMLDVKISDTGSGVQEDELETIFQPFKQSSVGKNNINSTGLGLPICKDFIELMDGTISVKKNSNHGSTFSFNIPISESTEAIATTDRTNIYENLKKYNLSELTVLIVEDTPTNVYLLKKLLERFNFKIVVAVNGKEGVEKYESIKPNIAFIDKNMPVMSGDEAILKIKKLETKLNIKTSIISLTADTFTEDINAMMKAGANFYMKKPFTIQELYEIIQSSLIYIGLEK